jgi:hypothetical protein
MKNDLSGARTVQDLERKYNFGELAKVTYENNDTLVHVNNELNEFVVETTRSLEDLQEQIDGEVTTWFYNGEPTLSNEPAVNWVTDEEKNNHLGDLYYDQSTGYAYRFVVNNNVYSWLQISDSAVAEALALAQAAQDTADNKRRVFMATPTPPYDRGDLWINNNEIYICNVAKDEQGTYQASDFIHNLKYTDDTLASIANGKANTINNTQVIKADSNGNLKTATIATDPSQGTSFNIKADNINFTGKTFNLTTDNMAINSTNFSVDSSGNLTCNNATMNSASIIDGDIKLKSQNTYASIELINANDTSEKVRLAPNEITFGQQNSHTISLDGDKEWGQIAVRDLVNDNAEVQIKPNYIQFYDDVRGYGTYIGAEGITAPNIQSGTATITNSSSGTTVTFSTPFDSVPNVVLTPISTASGNITIKIREITTTYFKAFNSTSSSVNCCWIAMV